MMAPGRGKLQLPKAILEMKFMKKTKDRIEKELANTKGHDVLYNNSISKEMRHAPENFISEPSFIFCEDLMEGRLSFKGMNPEIERLMESEQLSKQPLDDMEKDVSDEILAKKFALLKRKKPDCDFSLPSKKKRQ